jgi:hypothetical protein
MAAAASARGVSSEKPDPAMRLPLLVSAANFNHETDGSNASNTRIGPQSRPALCMCP